MIPYAPHHITQQVIPIPTTSVSVAPGGRQLIVSKQLPGELDIFLTDFGNSIDIVANSNFATFRVYVNGGPLPGFDNITSQIAAANLPRHYKPPIGPIKASLIEVWGEMAAAAAGNTVMSAQLMLVGITPGQVPNV